MIDNNSFELLVTAQTDTMYRVSMSMLKNEHDAQDAVQEAVLTAYRDLGKLRQEKYFGTWLIRILINQCHKKLKERKRYADIGDELPDIASRDNPYLSVEIGEAIDSLPEKVRLTVVLYYIDDYSVREIKDILRVPEGTVKSRLSKGRAMLREKLGE